MTRKPKEHVLKTWPEYFDLIVTGRKKFELRINDRDFQVGDVLILREWDNKEFSGREFRVEVTHMMTQGFGLAPEWCAMSIEPEHTAIARRAAIVEHATAVVR